MVLKTSGFLIASRESPSTTTASSSVLAKRLAMRSVARLYSELGHRMEVPGWTSPTIRRRAKINPTAKMAMVAPNTQTLPGPAEIPAIRANTCRTSFPLRASRLGGAGSSVSRMGLITMPLTKMERNQKAPMVASFCSRGIGASEMSRMPARSAITARAPGRNSATQVL